MPWTSSPLLTTHRAAALLLGGALTLALTGCGAAAEEDSATSRKQDATSAPATSAPVMIEYDTTTATRKPTISPDAISKYGAQAAGTGTDLALSTVDDYGYNDTLILSDEGENQQRVLDATEDMTPRAARDWEEAVDLYIDGNPAEKQKAAGRVFSYSFYSPHSETPGPDAATINGKVITSPNFGPGAVNKEVTSVRTSLDDQGRLQVDTKTAADLRVNADGMPKLWSVTRDSTYYLVRHDDAWRIDGWTGTFAVGGLRADK